MEASKIRIKQTKEEEKKNHQWKTYLQELQTYNAQLLHNPSTFSLSHEERFYLQCQSVRLPPLCVLYKLHLPLRINFIHSEILGCQRRVTDKAALDLISDRINQLWNQAGIVWKPIVPVDRIINYDSIPRKRQEEIKNIILTQITRSHHDKAKTRRRIFLTEILSLFDDYQQKSNDDNIFDIWLFDIIGDTSQGACIDKEKRTIIMGERSNKGYPEYTVRPLSNLATTMGHELGHALNLGHPRHQKFSRDGQPHNLSGIPNVMEGGFDLKGGGGEHLEQWQICMARAAAQEFLIKQNNQSSIYEYRKYNEIVDNSDSS